MENLPPSSVPAAQPQPVLPPPPKTSGLAITSLVFGIFSLIGGFCLLFPPILAVVFGHVSVSQTKKNPGLSGRGLGLAGLIMGYVAILPMIFFSIGLFAAMSIPAFQKVRTASQEKAILNNTRMLAAAADQFYLESGKTVASMADIVGPDKYVKQLIKVDREEYPALFEQGREIVVVKKDGGTIRYSSP